MEVDAILLKKAEMIAAPLREFFYRLEPHLNPFESQRAATLLSMKRLVVEHLSNSRPDAAIALLKEHYADMAAFLVEEVPANERPYHRENFNAVWAQVTT